MSVTDDDFDPIAIARQSLAQAKAYQASTERERRRKAENIAQIEAFIARLTHPTHRKGTP